MNIRNTLFGVLAIVPCCSFAEVDWLANSVVIDEGTAQSPVEVTDTKTLSSATLYVGKDDSGALFVNGGLISLTGTQQAYIGYNGDGYLHVASNATEGAVGKLSANRNLYCGKNAAATATVLVDDGGLLSVARELYLGDNGRARLVVSNATVNARGTYLGNAAGSDGTLEVREGGLFTIGSNYPLHIGFRGAGRLLMRGGEVSAKDSAIVSLEVRGDEDAEGVVSGWGTIALKGKSSNRGHIVNSGLVIADGRDDLGTVAERTLAITSAYGAFTNIVENVSTNGWYARNGGLLTVSYPPYGGNLPLAAGDSGVVTWGEAEDDDVIDLVNSARTTFHGITDTSEKKQGIYSFTGNLYAADRDDVPALPGGVEAVGIWKFDISGLYETLDVEFRYDHIKAPKGVKIYQLGADGETWTKLETVGLDGYRAKVSGVAAGTPLMFAAAAASSSGTIVIIR